MRVLRIILLLLLLLSIYCTQPNHYDVIIRGGTIIDGTGKAAFSGDVGIIWDTIEKIGNLEEATANKEINAQGLYITPGFIDINSKSSFDLLIDGRAVNKVRQGITSVIFSEGESPGPVIDRSIPIRKRKLSKYEDIPSDWTTLNEYLDLIKRRGISVNVGNLIGSGQIRGSIAGFSSITDAYDHTSKIFTLLYQAINDGTLGIGVDYFSIPGCYHNPIEILQTYAFMANRFDLFFALRLKNENDKVLAGLSDILIYERRFDLPVEIMELKYAGPSNPEIEDKLLSGIENLRSQDFEITANIIPSTAYTGKISELFPGWCKELSLDNFLNNLRDVSTRRRIEQEIMKVTRGWPTVQEFWKHVRLIELDEFANQNFIGQSLYDITEGYLHPLDVISRIIIKEDKDIRIQFETISGSFIEKAIAKPWVTVSAGTAAGSKNQISYEGKQPITNTGVLSNTLSLAKRDEFSISVEELIHKMTLMNARKLNLKQRGAIEEGLKADLSILDLDSILPTASAYVDSTYDNGIRIVFVNGKIVFENSEHTGASPGVLFKK
jgi:N-acyl-D-amino-acid deacylase